MTNIARADKRKKNPMLALIRNMIKTEAKVA